MNLKQRIKYLIEKYEKEETISPEYAFGKQLFLDDFDTAIA